MIFFKKINIFQENTENITNRIILYRIWMRSSIKDKDFDKEPNINHRIDH
jgi:uncharacterized protein YihD (DUF1040 family)